MIAYRVYQQYKSDILFEQTLGYFKNEADAANAAKHHIMLNPGKEDSILIEPIEIN